MARRASTLTVKNGFPRGSVAGSSLASTLSEAAIHGNVAAHGATTRAANRRNAGVRGRSPLAGTGTATDRIHPAPNVLSVTAASPSLQRAVTRPVGGLAVRSIGATTVAARDAVFGEPSETPSMLTANAVSGGDRLRH